MLGENLKSTLEVLRALAEVETAVAELYKEAASAWPEDKEFWSKLEAEERKHAFNMTRMLELVSKTPDSFFPGRTFTLIAIRTILSGLQAHRKRVAAGEMPRRSMFAIAQDIELSLIESKCTEILRTEMPEYVSLAKGILEDTRRHKSAIDERVRTLVDPPPGSQP